MYKRQAQANPKSAIARIAAVLDGLGVQSDLEQMFDCFPVGRQVFGGEVYPCPPVDARHVQPYVDVYKRQTTSTAWPWPAAWPTWTATSAPARPAAPCPAGSRTCLSLRHI